MLFKRPLTHAFKDTFTRYIRASGRLPNGCDFIVLEYKGKSHTIMPGQDVRIVNGDMTVTGPIPVRCLNCLNQTDTPKECPCS